MPAIEELKWNVDCSAFGKTGRTRIGGVLRDHKGVVLCLFSAFVGIKESNKTELLGVLKALELAASSE
ncbi:hypothetical protein NC651_027902 [Populus alba x Populus x berolinensis]|nr:hypothetical protein NC651_027862 [Populus alba x Populus x berolinensis]KAJ6881150.1 hypothetical protein NC651_027871 [Populus alba x Populus x berolinensis]KAJ6881158.1 hypothetical protein NC651_027878 [Populus alba x Populus x berolinensis]KAJ6881167.1 hypothetical protein NC651_027886 [Populus alba x Populus x berolinensis]KAJ6881175.1 hypothetical protein NC651_027893 [Populus alba x Populus x berolinensis]